MGAHPSGWVLKAEVLIVGYEHLALQGKASDFKFLPAYGSPHRAGDGVRWRFIDNKIVPQSSLPTLMCFYFQFPNMKSCSTSVQGFLLVCVKRKLFSM